MNTGLNVTLLSLGTALISIGAASIGANLLAGTVQIVLGLAVYLVYELTPSK